MMFETTKRERHYLIIYYHILFNDFQKRNYLQSRRERWKCTFLCTFLWCKTYRRVFNVYEGFVENIDMKSALHSENATSVCCATSLTLKYTCDRRNPVKLNYKLFWWKHISKSSIYLKYIMNNADTSEIITYRLH